MIVDAIIPALNEEGNMPFVLEGLAGATIRRVIVVDNGSTDGTEQAATACGATVVREPVRGYGRACLAGLRHLALDPPEIVLFLDGDGSDDPASLPGLLHPLESGQADLVIGSRTLGVAESGALTPVQKFGNTLSVTLIRHLFGVSFTDLGPFRAITWPALNRLEMADEDFGWTVEMQVKAARRGLRCAEVPVHSRRRYSGDSKISGTISGSVKAGVKILYVIGRELIR